MARQTKTTDFSKYIGWILLIGGLLAMVASILLANEVFTRLKDPSYVPVCNLNPILSCTSVADSTQAHAFGFPNYFIGIAGYAVVATVGAATLAGAQFKRWFWRAFMVGVALATVFIHWLIFETLYRIGALCVFCMVIWSATLPIVLYTKLYNLQMGNLPYPKRFAGMVRFAQRYHLEILIVWFLIIIALILKRFWYYWSTL